MIGREEDVPKDAFVIYQVRLGRVGGGAGVDGVNRLLEGFKGTWMYVSGGAGRHCVLGGGGERKEGAQGSLPTWSGVPAFF